MPTTTFETIAPDILLTPCPLPPDWGPVAAAVILIRDSRLAVVDTGVRQYMPAVLDPALAALDRRLSDIDLIINTHGHWDHIEGNPAIHAASGAPILIPAPDAPLLPAPPDRLLADGDTIDLGTRRFTVIAAPGHSAGMACLYDPAARLLIVSDAVEGTGLITSGIPLYFHSGRQYRESLARLAALDVDTLVLGHTFIWSGPPRFIHRGPDARRFLAESRDAADHIAAAIAAALAACPNRDPACLESAFLRHITSDTRFNLPSPDRLTRLTRGVFLTELRDHGITDLT